MQLFKRITTLILATAITTTLIAGCSGRSGSSKPSAYTYESEIAKDGATIASITPDLTAKVAEAAEENADTVGWVQVYNSSIEDVVLQKADDPTNEYYLRLDFHKNYDFDGVFYADYRATFGDGTREQLGTNTTIYGHAMTDNPEEERYSVKFGPLHDFRDPDLAVTMPYLFYSTAEETMAFEVFAVFVANGLNLEVPYNTNHLSQEEFVKMVREQVLPRSKYDYGIEIQDDDKFLTLSTCIYTLDDGTVTDYPDTWYRYAIMGRLVDPDEPLKLKAGFSENPDPVVDPDGIMK